MGFSDVRHKGCVVVLVVIRCFINKEDFSLHFNSREASRIYQNLSFLSALYMKHEFQR